MHHAVPMSISRGGMSGTTGRWWRKITGQDEKPTQPKPETRRLIRKALEASVEKAPSPPSEVERVPANLRPPLPRHTRHGGVGHVHFFREHLLFGKTYVKKDPITGKFKRTRKTETRQGGFYNADGSLHNDDKVVS